jgi:hypothetical protein
MVVGKHWRRRMPEKDTKRKRSFWFDPRFAIGLALVVISVAGVVGLVAQANASVDVMAARTTLTPGERVSASDLVTTSVRAGQTEKLYLSPQQVPTGGVVITRAIAAGELVPASAVGSSAGSRLTSVMVNLGGELPASIAPGSRVDLWSAAQASTTTGDDAAATREPGVFDAPAVIVSSAIVVRIVDEKSVVSSSSSSVELLVPKSDTASVLDAIANGAALSIVPVDLPLGQ